MYISCLPSFLCFLRRIVMCAMPSILYTYILFYLLSLCELFDVCIMIADILQYECQIRRAALLMMKTKTTMALFNWKMQSLIYYSHSVFDLCSICTPLVLFVRVIMPNM